MPLRPEVPAVDGFPQLPDREGRPPRMLSRAGPPCRNQELRRPYGRLKIHGGVVEGYLGGRRSVLEQVAVDDDFECHERTIGCSPEPRNGAGLKLIA